MSAPDLPRFKVSSDTWTVLDTWDLHRVVAEYGNPAQGVSPARRQVSLDKRCAELEAWHEQAMASDPA